MATLRLGMTMSIDGFINDGSGDSMVLYKDLGALQGTDYMNEEVAECGAVLMGRGAYDMSGGDLTGYEFQTPIFVVTHEAPEKDPVGENDNLKITFVTDGLESAVAQAKKAAGDKTVISMGGAETAHELLNAHLVDELQIDIMPILLKQGARFFDELEGAPDKFEKVKIREEGERTSIRYRAVR